MHAGHYLVCYDITDPKRLHKVFRISRRFGTPFQYSVLHFYGSQGQLDELMARLADVIDPASDDVRAYRIRSLEHITTLGQPINPDGVFW
mgnify:CR=1 FL=1